MILISLELFRYWHVKHCATMILMIHEKKFLLRDSFRFANFISCIIFICDINASRTLDLKKYLCESSLRKSSYSDLLDFCLAFFIRSIQDLILHVEFRATVTWTSLQLRVKYCVLSVSNKIRTYERNNPIYSPEQNGNKCAWYICCNKKKKLEIVIENYLYSMLSQFIGIVKRWIKKPHYGRRRYESANWSFTILFPAKWKPTLSAQRRQFYKGRRAWQGDEI